MSDEDKGFEVVDKRTGAEPEEAPTQAEPTVEATEEVAEEEHEHVHGPGCDHDHDHDEEHDHEHEAPDAYTTITWMIGLLASQAWLAMGLQINPSTGKIEKDLEQAKVCIDCAMSLSDRISAHLDEASRKELRGMISDLQVNFVNQSKEG
jgi:ABC-type Zn2+ transport system substrate-binding protein/surface adhesin